MLVSVLNNTDDPTFFQQDFTENIILPPNCTVKMLKAFIPITRGLSIPTNAVISYQVGGLNSSGHSLTIPSGVYNLSVLALTIQQLIQSDIDTKKLQAKCIMTHDNSMGAEVGAFNFILKNLTLYPNVAVQINWNDASTPKAEFTALKDDTLLSVATPYLNYYSMGVSAIKSSANPAVDVNSWGHISSFDVPQTLLKTMYRNDNPNGANIPPISHADTAYGALWWSNRYGGLAGATDATYAMTVCSAGVGVGGVTTNNDIGQVTKWTGCYSVMVVMGKVIPNNPLLPAMVAKGDLLVYEVNTVGALNLVLHYKGGIGANDQVAVVIPETEGETLEYYHRFNGSTAWRELDGFVGTRYANPDTDDLYMGFSAFNAMPTPTAPSQANVTALYGSFDFQDIYDGWGEYVKINWGTVQTQLGFSQAVYDDDTSGGALPILAEIDINNEDPLPVNDSTPEENRIPYVNIDINELPIQNYTNNNPTSLGLSTSRTICSVPRYDMLGQYATDKADAIVFDNNTHSSPLNNAQEITLSQLTFTLRNADGTIPNDLGTPQGYILDIQPQSI